MDYLILLLIIVILFCLMNYKTERFSLIKMNSNQKELFTHLSYIHEALNKNHIRHWLMYGTLLGAVRDKAIIPYDYDFDLGAYVDSVDDIIELNKQINKDGYKVYKPFNNGVQLLNTDQQARMWRVSFKVEYKNKVVGDIYLYKKCPDGYLRRYDPESGAYFWPNSMFHCVFTDNLQKVNIHGKQFPAPIHADFLLEYWYGHTWKTPIRAKAQGGKGDPNSDYYGSAKKIELVKMIDYLDKIGVFNTKPYMIYTVKTVYPKKQVQWIFQNDNVLNIYKDRIIE